MSDTTAGGFGNYPAPPANYQKPGPCWCNDDKTTGGHYHYQRGGMADRVHIDRNGARYNAGLSFVFPVCPSCGAVVVDDGLHDAFHERLEHV